MKVLKEKVKLYEHQKLALNTMAKEKRWGLYLEMGLGKTLIGLADIVRKIHLNGVSKVLVVATKAIIPAWKRDMELLTDQARELVEKYVTFTNYEQLVGRKFTRNNKIEVKYSKDGEKIMATQWDYVIFDECQKIKDHKTNSHKNALKLAYRATYVYLLTGSPVVNGQLVNYHAYDLFLNPEVVRGKVNSKAWGSLTSFKNTFGILDQWYNIKIYHDVDDILDHVKSVSTRMYSKDWLDLPDMLEPEIWTIDMNAKQKSLYKEMMKTSTIESEELLAENAASRLNYLRQIASGFYYKDIIEDEEAIGREAVSFSKEKAKVLEDYLKENEDPIVIFYNYMQELKDIEEVLNKLKIKYLTLNGSTKQKDRGNWRVFQSDKKYTVFVTQVQSGARGIDLFKASTTIYYSLPLSSEIFEQSKKRTNRIGTKKPSSYIIFASEGTVEYAIYEALNNYLDFNERLFTVYIKTYEKGQKI